MKRETSDPEAAIREAWDRKDYEQAATRLIVTFGPEIQGFLAAWMNDRRAAAEAFSLFAQDLWVALPKFAWRCSARGWAYTLARNAGRRHARAEQRRRERHIPIPDSLLSEVAAQTRTRTDTYLKTEVKDRMRELRERLPLEDQQILILRVGRNLSWPEIAMVLAEDGLTCTSEELDRETARLRKRFQLAKERLRAMARDSGLVK
jgi:RNA polymerase sigma-70 factor (ECF subfamily)